MNLISISRELDILCKRLSNLIIDVNYCRVSDTITWAEYTSGVHNHVNYYYEYRWIIDNRQFSFLLPDGGALQFYYRFQENELLSSRQCYYPPPLHGIKDYGESDLEISLDDMLSVNIRSDEAPPPYRAKHWSHIRLDFDAKVMSHDPSHLQYSAVSLFRIPADKVLSPFVFLDMVLRDFYPDDHSEYLANEWYRGMLTESARNSLASRIGRLEAVRVSCP
jgi:hypothetical protein